MVGFFLSSSGRILRADGVRVRFTDIHRAAAAMRSHQVEMIVGAVPFDPGMPAALVAPFSPRYEHGSFLGPLAPLPTTVVVRESPDREVHMERVAALVESIGNGPLRKVVAARSVELRAAEPLDPMDVVNHLLVRDPNAHGYVVDLTPADRLDAVLVGASPELLIAKHGETVRLQPLAGTAPRLPELEADVARGDQLLSSSKDQAEHAYVVDWIRERLDPWCRTVTMPAQPQLTSTPDVWHLATPIIGELRSPDVTVLDLVAELHPTPALCGLPMPEALLSIAHDEGDRGFYGGAVGWCDRNGDGEWAVAIRCVEIQPDRRLARAYAGGGIVADSDPSTEYEETSAKLRTVLSVLGVDMSDRRTAEVLR